MRQLLACTAALGVLLAVPAASGAKSVNDRDLGWPAAQLRRLHLPKVLPGTCHRAAPHRESRAQKLIEQHGDPTEALRRVFHYRWGGAWIDPCDHMRMGIGVPPSGAAHVAKARQVIARHHLTSVIRLYAVRSTGREIEDAIDAFYDRFEPLSDQGLLTSFQIERGIMVIELAKPLDAQNRKAIHAYALAAPIAIVVRDTDEHDFTAIPV
jgi:hypothetical protein